MTPAIDRIIDALSGVGQVKQSGGQWQAQCPAHEDRAPSLSIRPIEGSVLMHCHAGCRLVDVLAALDMTPRDLYDEPRGKELTRYQYTNAAGQPTRTVHRLDGKRFSQSGDKAQCHLYRLPKVIEAATFGRTVYLVEGEKDVHAIESLGEVATTAPQGAENFGRVDVSPLKGAQVVAVVDRDAAGEKWAAEVRKRLDGFAGELSLVEAAEGKDAADHIAAGHLLDALVPVEVKQTGRRLVLTSAADIEPEPVVWAWRHEDFYNGASGRIPLGSLSVAAGREGTGKSSFGIWLAAMITRGTLPGSLYGQPRAVIYAAVEDSWKYTLVPRLIAAGADLTKVFRVEVVEDEQDGTTLSLPVDNALLEREMRRVGAALLVLDPLMSTIGAGIDTHRERDVRVALDPLARLADRARCVVLGIAHFNKGGGTDPSSLITGSGAFKNVPRSVFGFAADPEGDRVMTQTKNSLGRLDLPSLAYQIEGVEIPTRLGPAHVGRLVWLGESDRSVTDILGDRGDPDEREERAEVVDWIVSYLQSHGGEAPAADVMKKAKSEGYAEATVKRARKKAKVVSERSGFPSTAVWRLPDPTVGSQSDHSDHRLKGDPTDPTGDPTVPDSPKGAPKGAPPRELRSSLPSLPSEPDSAHSWWVIDDRPEHPGCAACQQMQPAPVRPSPTQERPAPIPTPRVKDSTVMPRDWKGLFTLDAPALDPPLCETCGTPKAPDTEVGYFRLCPNCTSGSLRPANQEDN